MRKFFQNRKALSPVVASIILIAVTVSVSIIAAAWMGALTFTFIETERLQITDIEFTNTDGIKAILITVNNTGECKVTISEVWINGEERTSDVTYDPSSPTARAGLDMIITVFPYNWRNDTSYQIVPVSSAGNRFYYSAVAS